MTRSLYEKTTSLDAALPLISGVLMTLSLPRAEISGLAFIALVPLLYTIWRPQRKLSPFVCGLITGATLYLGTLYWLTLTMENYGGVPRWLSLLILFLFALYLAVYTGLFSWLVVALKWFPMPLFLTAPFLWVTLEYGRGHLLTGFPWALLGYSQYRNLPLIQVSDMTGVYGVSFIVVLVNTALFESLYTLSHWRRARTPFPPYRLTFPLLAAIFCLASALGYGAWRMDQLRAMEPQRFLQVGVVQGNIEQNHKWDPLYRDKIIATHTRLTREIALEKPDVIIWPEASVPFYFMAEQNYQSQLLTLIDDMGINLLFGSPDLRVKDEKQNFYNSVFLVSPGAVLKGSYDKIHLVPFGEYIPLRRALFFLNPIIEQIGDMTPGDAVTLMELDQAVLGTPICYEIVLPHLVRRFVSQGADVIATLTNDNWFGRSSAPYQHFSMAVFRAVENRVPVVRSANSGISGLIAPDGRITKETELFTEDAFSERLPLLNRPHPIYTRFGDLFAWGCIAVTAATLIVHYVLLKGGRGASRQGGSKDRGRRA
ncbi:MAG: apolipoprotein N-acyltransferase [bacterium]|nr:apolipoprotein N-acyltransferase [bacterium]